MTQLRVVAAERNAREQQARSRLLDPQDQGLGNPAGDDRAADGGGRPLRAAVSVRDEATAERAADRAGLRGRALAPTTSTGARSRSTAARTKSRRTSSPRRSWGCEALQQRWTSSIARGRPEHRPASLRTDERRHGGHGLRIPTNSAAEGLRAAARSATIRERKYGRAGRLEPRDCGGNMPSSACSALPFAEEHGGIGGGPVETMIVMEAFGRALALEPYLATVVLGGGFLRHGASDAQQRGAAAADRGGRDAACLRAYRAAGALRPRRRRDHARRRTAPATCSTARRAVVLHGDCADKLIVTARVSRRAARPRRHRAVSGRRRRPRRVAPRLSDHGRPARRRSHARGRARSAPTP